MLPLDFQLAANETQRHSRIGNAVYVESATGPIRVTAYSSNGIIVGRKLMGVGHRMRLDVDYTVLEIEDRSGAANAVELLAGLGDYRGAGVIDSIADSVGAIEDLQRGGDWTEFDHTGLNGQQLIVASPTNAAGMELAFLYATTGDGTGTTWHNGINCQDPVDNQKWICGFEPAYGSPAIDRYRGILRVPAGWTLGVQTDAVGGAQGYYRLL